MGKRNRQKRAKGVQLRRWLPPDVLRSRMFRAAFTVVFTQLTRLPIDTRPDDDDIGVWCALAHSAATGAFIALQDQGLVDKCKGANWYEPVAAELLRDVLLHPGIKDYLLTFSDGAFTIGIGIDGCAIAIVDGENDGNEPEKPKS